MRDIIYPLKASNITQKQAPAVNNVPIMLHPESPVLWLGAIFIGLTIGIPVNQRNHLFPNYNPRDINANFTVLPPGPVTCFHPNPIYIEPPLDHCATAILIMHRDVPWYTQQRTFSLHPKEGEMQLPIRFRDRSCEVWLNSTRTDVSDTFALVDVARTPFDIVKRCVREAKPGFKYGGYAGVGNEKGIYFQVRGIKRGGAANGGEREEGGDVLTFEGGNQLSSGLTMNSTIPMAGKSSVLDAGSVQAVPDRSVPGEVDCPVQALTATA